MIDIKTYIVEDVEDKRAAKELTLNLKNMGIYLDKERTDRNFYSNIREYDKIQVAWSNNRIKAIFSEKDELVWPK